MVNIFESCGNPTFFSVLSRPSQELYWNVICKTYDCIMSDVESRIDKVTFRIIIDEAIAEFNNTSGPATFASEAVDIINTLLDAGWINQSYDGIKGLDFYAFSEFAKKFIQFNYQYQGDRVKTEEYMKLLEIAVNDMTNMTSTSDTYEHPYRSGLLRLKDNIDSLLNEVENIGRHVRSDIECIFKTTHTKELVSKMKEYITEVNEGYIANLYKYSVVKPSVSIKVQEIIGDIKSNSDLRNRNIVDMEKHYSIQGISKNREELVEEMYSLLDYIYNRLNIDLPKRRDAVEKLKSEIINKSMHKFDILSASNYSYPIIVDKMINILSGELTDTDEEYFIDIISNMFNYNEMIVAEPGNLYEKRDMGIVEYIEPVVDVVITDDDIQKISKAPLSMSQTANNYVMGFLGDADEIKASDIPDTEENIEKIKIIGSYADYSDTQYGIEILDEKIIKGEYLMDNFIIRKVKC